MVSIESAGELPDAETLARTRAVTFWTNMDGCEASLRRSSRSVFHAA
jgi:hypothetical protein